MKKALIALGMINAFCLNLFDGINKTTDTTATTGNDLSNEMKTYYSDYLIDLAEPELVHDQFAQKHPIPANGGKAIEFRKYDSLPKALTPLSEGITPTGQKLNMSVITANVYQYGGFIELSDVLLLTAIDNNLVQATKLLASQAGRTLDTVTREVLNGGTNVLYADGKTARSALVGGEASGNSYITVKDVRKAARALKVVNGQKINGYYAGIIHPDVEFELMNDPEWKYPHQYKDTQNLYDNELGEIGGVRFVESTEAKIFCGADLTAAARNLTVASLSGKIITVDETLTSDDQAAIKGRKIIIQGAVMEVTAAAAHTITVADLGGKTPADGDVVYPGEGGAKGVAVYSTLILADNAYGVTEITGGGLQHIVKQLGSAGTADPLNQRATAGWKAMKAAERLVEQYMIRIESTSSFDDVEAN